MSAFSRKLQWLGRLVPIWLPYGTAVGNRVLKPIYRLFDGSPSKTTEIWPGIRMQLDPCECVGGNLFFCPQLYDQQERLWIVNYLDSDGVFIDVGANIGAYTLWAASKMNESGRILAIEADPDTFLILSRNIEVNKIFCQIKLENNGVSDANETLTFFRNIHRNTGANSFLNSKDSLPSLKLSAEPLYDILIREEILRVDFLKIDIEGFEFRVLKRYFEDCVNNRPNLLAKYLLIELGEGPRRDDKKYQTEIMKLLADFGYIILHPGKNSLFRLAKTFK